LAFAVRLQDTFRPDEDVKNLFVEWLRGIPTLAKEVKIEVMFDSFSTFLIVSVPFKLSAYIPHVPAVTALDLSCQRII
jgi:hypothetical protein